MQEGVKLTEGLTQMLLLYSDLISHTQQTRKNQHTYKQWKIEFETLQRSTLSLLFKITHL